MYEGDELAQTLAATREPMRTLFALAAVTGARLAELLGLTLGDRELADAEAAEVRIQAQVDRSGERRPLKTAESRRTIELPASLAAALKRHRLSRGVPAASAFVFATRSGRAFAQRNVLRASVVTRAIYVQELRTVERKAKRRARMETQYGDALCALEEPTPTPRASHAGASVRELRARLDA